MEALVNIFKNSQIFSVFVFVFFFREDFTSLLKKKNERVTLNVLNFFFFFQNKNDAIFFYAIHSNLIVSASFHQEQ